MGKLYEKLEIEIKTAHLPERAVTAVMDAARKIKVRNCTYHSQADNVSDQVASRDLKDLVTQGFLVGSARGRHYEASEKVMQIKESIWDRKKIESPYTKS